MFSVIVMAPSYSWHFLKTLPPIPKVDHRCNVQKNRPIGRRRGRNRAEPFPLRSSDRPVFIGENFAGMEIPERQRLTKIPGGTEFTSRAGAGRVVLVHFGAYAM